MKQLKGECFFFQRFYSLRFLSTSIDLKSRVWQRWVSIAIIIYFLSSREKTRKQRLGIWRNNLPVNLLFLRPRTTWRIAKLELMIAKDVNLAIFFFFHSLVIFFFPSWISRSSVYRFCVIISRKNTARITPTCVLLILSGDISVCFARDKFLVNKQNIDGRVWAGRI